MLFGILRLPRPLAWHQFVNVYLTTTSCQRRLTFKMMHSRVNCGLSTSRWVQLHILNLGLWGQALRHCSGTTLAFCRCVYTRMSASLPVLVPVCGFYYAVIVEFILFNRWRTMNVMFVLFDRWPTMDRGVKLWNISLNWVYLVIHSTIQQILFVSIQLSVLSHLFNVFFVYWSFGWQLFPICFFMCLFYLLID